MLSGRRCLPNRNRHPNLPPHLHPQAFSTHHAAVLIGYGAHAICPYLAYETARQWRTSSRTLALIKTGKVPDVSIEKAQANLKKSLEKGILKIISKMGISLLSCYHGEGGLLLSAGHIHPQPDTRPAT
jgi:hypothetical protein